MAKNKNQHFVPRCHLKPFTLDRQGVAINVYNHVQDRFIQNAPVRGQCSKSYFYGEDLELETRLQQEEGKYSEIVRRIVAEEQLPDQALSYLRSFTYLQQNRTFAAVERRREAFLRMEGTAHQGFKNVPPADISHAAMLNGVFRTWAGSLHCIEDMPVAIIRNRSGRDFITSDDPAIVTNRVHIQRLKDHSFGLINCGTMLVMPLSPRYAVIAYDHDAYAPIGREGQWITTSREADVDALNELQMLNAASNLYFSNAGDAAAIGKEFKRIAERRIPERFKFWSGIQIEDEHGMECYRRATELELQTTATRITNFSPVFPAPSRWFSKLTFRNPLIGYANNSPAGLVREQHMIEGGKYRKIRVGIRSTGPDPKGPEKMHYSGPRD